MRSTDAKRTAAREGRRDDEEDQLEGETGCQPEALASAEDPGGRSSQEGGNEEGEEGGEGEAEGGLGGKADGEAREDDAVAGLVRGEGVVVSERSIRNEGQYVSVLAATLLLKRTDDPRIRRRIEQTTNGGDDE